MGTQQSYDGAANVFVTISGDLQGLASGEINTINKPANNDFNIWLFIKSFIWYNITNNKYWRSIFYNKSIN